MDDFIFNHLNDNFIVGGLGVIKLKHGKVDRDSLVFKTLESIEIKLNDIIGEVNLIFSDGEESFSDITKKWVDETSQSIIIDANDKINEVNKYFINNLSVKLGTNKWEVYMNGVIFNIKTLYSEFNTSNGEWLDTKLIIDLYDNWFNEAIITYTEKSLNFY